MMDLKIINGEVIDGSGTAPARVDVGISGDRISDLGDLSSAEAEETINASGRIVAPGFIDAHSHSDAFLLIEPTAQSKIFQGITTEVIGNCGASAAPLTGQYRMPADWQNKRYPRAWRTVTEYRRLLEEVSPAVNAALLVGHNNLRAGVMGYENRPPSTEEQDKMIRLLEQSLGQGARGMSTGLIYAPGMYSAAPEIGALAGVVAKRKGVYTSHMRNEGTTLLESVRETIGVGRSSGARVQISHLKASGAANWQKMDEALALIEEARASGISAAADCYPYTAGCTELDAIFPRWAHEGGRQAVLRRVKDNPQRERLRDELADSRVESDWASITVASTAHPDNRRFQGRALSEIAADMGVAPAEAALRIVERDELTTTAFFHGISEENMRKALARPYVMVGTDASLRAMTGPLSEDYPHPRAFGAFPRFLRMALDDNLVPIQEAVRKITSLPATQFGLADRGLIAKGKPADIVVFDPDAIRDTATYECPRQLSRGIDCLIVNGAVTIRDCKMTGVRAGRAL